MDIILSGGVTAQSIEVESMILLALCEPGVIGS